MKTASSRFLWTVSLSAALANVHAQAGQESQKAAKPQVESSDSAFDMEALMNQTTEAGKTSDILFKGKNGAWVLARGRETGAARTCSVIYFDRQNGTSISYRGPRPDVGDKGSLVFIGPAIPNAKAPTQVRVTLETDGERPQTIQAGHLPKQGEAPPAILVSTDIRATIDVIQPTEKVRLLLGKKLVYALEWEGGHAAKDALLNCLSGR